MRGGLNGSADPDDAAVPVADDGGAAVAVVVPLAVDHRAAAADVESCRRVRRRDCGAWRRSAASLQFQAVLERYEEVQSLCRVTQKKSLC